jgi:ferrous iron transport protein B
MDAIETGFEWLTKGIKGLMPDGPLSALICDGIIPGISGVLVFIPQIGILFFFIALKAIPKSIKLIDGKTQGYLVPEGTETPIIALILLSFIVVASLLKEEPIKNSAMIFVEIITTTNYIVATTITSDESIISYKKIDAFLPH